MLTLSNRATVHAAYIVPASPGMKAHGICLAETPTDWVVWNIYWDGEIDSLDSPIGPEHEVWEAENGDYFPKISSAEPSENTAHFIFGRRLMRFISDNMWQGMNDARS